MIPYTNTKTVTKLLIKKLDDAATTPTKAHSTDLGYDLYSLEDVTVLVGETKLIKTGICLKFPDGWGGFIEDRSSVATKQNLITIAGVIDENYTGEIRITMFNKGNIINNEPISIKKGEKIAQIVPIPVTDWEISVVDTLPETDRGSKGFGSSGN